MLLSPLSRLGLLTAGMFSVWFFQELFGAVQVTPLSSGYALGSSNWIIQSHYEKVSYVSGSSLLTTHPQVNYLLITTNLCVYLIQIQNVSSAV